jgi:glycogen synthase
MTTKSPVHRTDSYPIIRRCFWKADYILIRFETEYTPCTGITAVDKQERRQFPRGLMVAPWCPNIKRPPGKNPLENGKIVDTEYSYILSNGKVCRVLMTTDEFMPIFFLAIEGHFEGTENPYDVPGAALRMDALVFGEACEKLINQFGDEKQFIWGADWESVPVLVRLRGRHMLVIAFHNEFDECLEREAQQYGNGYELFTEQSSAHPGAKTALEIALEVVDVATAVNRGYAYGLQSETIHQRVMAAHLNHLTGRIVGINNAAFSPLSADLRDLLRAFEDDPKAGRDLLFALKSRALESLPSDLQSKTRGKVVIVSMGRRVPQKQHDVLVEAVRSILRKQKDLPLLLVLATVHGDDGSPARLRRMRTLEKEFPDNVVCLDGQIDFFAQLMQAADFNCLPSLWEPQGGAFDGTVVPIARAIDGLAEQIAPLDPRGEAARIAALWHSTHEQPTGFLFREPVTTGVLLEAELAELLQQSPSPENSVFRGMVEELTAVLVKAVALRLEEPERFANLLKSVLEKQEGTSWQVNLGGILALVEQRRAARMFFRAA